MNNSFYVFSNSPLIIERLHICTWDIKGAKSKMEIGMEIVNDAASSLQSPVLISLSMPFGLKGVYRPEKSLPKKVTFYGI